MNAFTQEFYYLIGHADYMTFFWVVTAIVFLLIELGSPGLFFFIAFAGGSLISALLAFVGCTFMVQCVVGLISSLALFWLIKKRFAGSQHEFIKTNTRALLGVQAMVTKQIDPLHVGRVKIRGEEWPAQVREDSVLQVGTLVQIVSIEGNRVIVKKYHHNYLSTKP